LVLDFDFVYLHQLALLLQVSQPVWIFTAWGAHEGPKDFEQADAVTDESFQVI